MRLKDHSIVVTGAGSGLGRALVRRLVEEGASVAALDKSARRLAALEQELGSNLVAHTGDVRSFEDNLRAVNLAEERFGKVDGFVGNAGVWDWMAELADLDPGALMSGFREVMEVNVAGFILGAKASMRALVRSRGAMVFTLSNAALYPAGGGVLYTASKHAGVGVVKQLAYELAPKVRVNGVAVGGFSSDLRGAEALGQAEQSLAGIDMAAMAPGFVPIGRFPELDEYLSFYILLLSRWEGGGSTGGVFSVDGGLGVRGFTSARGGDRLIADGN